MNKIHKNAKTWLLRYVVFSTEPVQVVYALNEVTQAHEAH